MPEGGRVGAQSPSSARPSHLRMWSWHPMDVVFVTRHGPLTSLSPQLTFGNHQQPSTLQQVPRQVPLDANSLGLEGGGRPRSALQRSHQEDLATPSPAGPWPSQTLAATSRTGFPRAAGRMVRLLYLGRQRRLALPARLHRMLRPVLVSKPHPLSTGAPRGHGATRPASSQVHGSTCPASSSCWNPGAPSQGPTDGLRSRRGCRECGRGPRLCKPGSQLS